MSMDLPVSTTEESRDLRAIAGAVPVVWMRARIFEIALKLERLAEDGLSDAR